MNKKILSSLVAGALIGGVALNLSPVLAQSQNGSQEGLSKNRVTERFARHGLVSKAEMLEISVEELQEKMATMTFSEILEEAGISMDEFQAKSLEQAKARWSERGISQEEIESRMEQLKARRESCDGLGDGSKQYQGSPFGKGRAK